MEELVLEAEERRKLIYNNQLKDNADALDESLSSESLQKEIWELKNKAKNLERDNIYLKDKLIISEELETLVKNLEGKLKKSKMNEKNLLDE